MDAKLFWTIITYAGSLVLGIGIYKTKIDSIEKRVGLLESKNFETTQTFTDIKVKLADIEAKLDLLVSGKTLKD